MGNSRTEQEIAEEKYKFLLRSIPGATAIYKGINMEIVMANKAMTDFWLTGESIIGKTLLEAVPDLEGQPFIGWLQQVFITGETRSGKDTVAYFMIDDRAQAFYYDFTYSALRDKDDNIVGVVHCATDVTERVVTRLKLAESDQRLNSSLQFAGIGTWNFDLETGSLVMDGRSKKFLGVPEDELPLEQSLKNVHPDDVRDVYNMIISCLSHATDSNCDARFRVIIDGESMKWLHFTGKAVWDEDKMVKWFAGIIRDITKETAGLEAQNKLQHQKDNFLSIASHELKTPVTSIKAYAQLLERMFKKEGDTQKADMLTRLTGQVNRLTALLEDLLDVSKITNDRLNFKRDFHSFNDIVEDNIRDINCQDEGHKIEATLEFAGNIYCDRMRISQVINNLISNAIKYSPETDKILIHTAQRGMDVVFSVQDFGIGISEENIDHVFDQFYRVSTAEAYSYQGMGLGLFISAEIIRQEGGRIWVESEENNGSTFCFSLPLGNNIR